MSYLLKRHPVEVRAFLKRSLVLAYAVPRERLDPLLSPGLSLDCFGDFGFLVVAAVETERLRPAMLPAEAGTSFFLVGYRLFVRYTNQAGKRLRGLQVLGSETDSPLMVRAGNLLTHYRYVPVQVQSCLEEGRYSVAVSRKGRLTLDVTAELSKHELPADSVFETPQEARSFAGPMPFTFDYESETGSMVIVEGVRSDWKPELAALDVRVVPSFERFGISLGEARLSSGFYLHDVPYRWKRGVIEKVA